MKHLAIIVAISALLVGSISCEKQRDVEPEEVPVVEEPKETPYVLDPTKAADFVQKGNVFAIDFIDRINAAEKGDFIVSPLSMQFLLGMILNGAQGKTADEICDVLGYGAGEVDAVNAFCLSMLEQLPALDQKTKVSIGNALFVNDMYPLLDSFKAIVGKHYQAETRNLDFFDAEKSLEIINGWANRQTNGMIHKVLDKVEEGMQSYLFNTVYFKGTWVYKFSKKNTAEEPFSIEDGKSKMVPMMKMEENLVYHENDVFQIVRLPYGNGSFQMFVLLPQSGKSVADVAAFLKTADWGTISQKMHYHKLDLWLPRFETMYEKDLVEILSEMGMPAAFIQGKADFGALTEFPLYLKFVSQKAKINVDEEGTVAAASSYGGGFLGAGAPEDPIVFHADHPFLYLITESSTGVVLFAGKYSGK